MHTVGRRIEHAHKQRLRVLPPLRLLTQHGGWQLFRITDEDTACALVAKRDECAELDGLRSLIDHHRVKRVAVQHLMPGAGQCCAHNLCLVEDAHTGHVTLRLGPHRSHLAAAL